MTALPGAYGIKSIEGQDANDALRYGELGALLAIHRFQAAKNQHEQMRLRCDLLDAAQVWPGPDTATLEVLTHISSVMGLSAIMAPTFLPTVPLSASVDNRPLLPEEMQVIGIQSYVDAWSQWQQLRENYLATMGKNGDGFYITAPFDYR